jgi:hypothetical protein
VKELENWNKSDNVVPEELLEIHGDKSSSVGAGL